MAVVWRRTRVTSPADQTNPPPKAIYAAAFPRVASDSRMRLAIIYMMVSKIPPSRCHSIFIRLTLKSLPNSSIINLEI